MLSISLATALLLGATDDMSQRTALAEAIVDATKQAELLEIQTEYGIELMGDSMPEDQVDSMLELVKLQHQAMLSSMVRAIAETHTAAELERALEDAKASVSTTDVMLRSQKKFLEYMTEESMAIAAETQAVFQSTETGADSEPELMAEPVAPVERNNTDFLPMTVGSEIAFELNEQTAMWGEDVRIPVTDAELMTVFSDMTAKLVSLEGTTRVSELSGVRAYTDMAQCNDALWLIESRLTSFIGDGDTPCGHSKLLNPANNQQAWLRCNTPEQMNHAELSFKMKHLPTSDAFQAQQEAYWQEQVNVSVATEEE